FDLREPRFLSQGDRLMLYVSRLGTNPLRFQPQGISVSEHRADGSWTGLDAVGPPGLVAWRFRVVDGQALMIGYTGGDHLYSFDGTPLRVELLSSLDGRRWAPAFGADGAVLRGGGSETDFALDGGGNLFAVVRNEAGDHDGFGSKLCRAAAGSRGA